MSFGQSYALICNRVGKKEYFVDGNWHFEVDTPRLYPYNNKQEQDDVLLHAKRTSILSDAGEITVYKVDLALGSSKIKLVHTITRADAELFRKLIDAEDVKIIPEKPKVERKKRIMKMEVQIPKEISLPPLDKLFDD